MADETVGADLDVKPVSEIELKNIHEDPETGTFQFDDAAAVKLVLDDTSSADNYMNINQWPAGWTMAANLLQSPQSVSAFEGGNTAQANVPKFMVSNHISAIVPRVMSGLFYEDPPFLLRPRPGTKDTVIRAKTALFAAQLWDMKFEEESERALDQMALLGTCIMKWGYAEYEETDKRYRRPVQPMTISTPLGPSDPLDTPESDEFEIYYETRRVSRPWIKYCDIRTVLVDPGCRYGDIRRANHVIYRDYATYSDLNKLRDIEGYDIPDEATLKALFILPESLPDSDNPAMTITENMRGYLQQAVPRNSKHTADPMQNGLEILERWDAEKVIVLLTCNNHNILIRNEPNPYGKIPFLSANWRNIPDCFYGQGIGLLIGSEQVVEQGTTNLALDLLAYGLQPTAIRKKGFNTPTQTIRWGQGKIIDVDDDVEKAFKFMTMPPVPGETWEFIRQSQTAGAASSGANEQVMQGAGASGAQTTGMRSGTGAAAVIQANASRLDGPVGRFVRQIFEPWIYQMDQLNNELLPTSVLRKVLGDELGEGYMVDHLEFREAKLEYEVLAGAHLGAKKEMAQFLPLMIQMFNNPSFAQNITEGGQKWDGVAIFKEFANAAGWKYSQSFLIPMTPEEIKKRDDNSPSALQARQIQGQKEADHQKYLDELEKQNEKQLGITGGEILRDATYKAMESEVTGVPGNKGFGSETVA